MLPKKNWFSVSVWIVLLQFVSDLDLILQLYFLRLDWQPFLELYEFEPVTPPQPQYIPTARESTIRAVQAPITPVTPPRKSHPRTASQNGQIYYAPTLDRSSSSSSLESDSSDVLLTPPSRHLTTPPPAPLHYMATDAVKQIQHHNRISSMKQQSNDYQHATTPTRAVSSTYGIKPPQPVSTQESFLNRWMRVGRGRRSHEEDEAIMAATIAQHM